MCIEHCWRRPCVAKNALSAKTLEMIYFKIFQRQGGKTTHKQKLAKAMQKRSQGEEDSEK